MATNYIQPGRVIDYTAPSDVSSGDLVVFGQRAGVALADIPAGSRGAVQVVGVFEVPKASGVAFGQGDLVYWNETSGHATADPADVLAGIAFTPADAADDTVNVKLNS